MLELSQVIYGVRDLDAATERMQALGLTVLDGGRHPVLGTANRIIPLGSAYLCPDCNSISNSARRCPACASEVLMSLAGVLDRRVEPVSEPKYACVNTG